MDAPPELPPPPPVAIALAWERAAGAEECIEDVTLAARLQGTLGRAVAVSSAHRANAADATDAADTTEVSGRIAPLAGGGWFAVVDVRRVGGATLHREVALAVPDCRELDEATVLVVALLVDAAVPRVPRLTLPPPAATTVLAVGPEVTFATGLLPGGLATGVGLTASVEPPGFWPITVWGRAWPAVDALQTGFGGTFDAWIGGAGLCPRIVGHDRLALLVCAGVSAGVVDSTGLNLDRPQSRSRPYVDVELDVGLRVPLVPSARHFFVRVEGGAAVPLTRNDYTFVDEGGESRLVFRTAAVVPVGRVALEAQTP